MMAILTTAPAAGRLGMLADDKAPSLEYEVKAAFLLNFTKFIEWPHSVPASRPFSICILGDDPFKGAIDRIMAGESVEGRRLVVQRIGHERPRGCQIVFADHSQRDVAAILSGLGPGVLTVGEGDDFLRAGGMIAFVIESHHVRFKVNPSAAAHAALKISSKLLSVARPVGK